MWLLDHNLPKQLLDLFKKKLKLPADTVRNRKWDQLENGELVKVAIKSGFTCILTRDVRFRESAAKTFQDSGGFSIVLITLKQQRSSLYVQAFQEAWTKNPIQPIPGKLTIWP